MLHRYRRLMNVIAERAAAVAAAQAVCADACRVSMFVSVIRGQRTVAT